MSRDQISRDQIIRKLGVNPIACQAHGMCIEVLPELISGDPWGYPVIAPGGVPAELMPLARRAVSSCPTMALLLMGVEQTADELSRAAASAQARDHRREPR
jgi:ferredoxin